MMAFIAGCSAAKAHDRRRVRCGVRASAGLQNASWEPIGQAHMDVREQLIRNLERALRSGDEHEANAIYKRMLANMYIDTVNTHNRVLAIFAKFSPPARTRKVLSDLDQCFDPTVVSYNTVMACYARKKELAMVEKIFYEEMPRARLKPDQYSYSTLLSVYAALGKTQEVEEVLNEMRGANIPANVVTLTSVMKGFAKCGDAKSVARTFQSMERARIVPDKVAYSVLIDALGKSGEVDAAEDAATEMVAAGVKPDVVTISSLMKINLAAGRYEKVTEHYEKIIQLRLEPNDVVFGILLDTARQLGDVGAAEGIFSAIQQGSLTANRTIIRSMMQVYASKGDLVGIRRCFRTLKDANLTPEARDFSILLGACAELGGYMQLAENTWSEMKRVKVKPPVATVNNMLRCCVAAGETERAEEIFREIYSMRMRPTLISFGLLISAYGKGGDLAAAERVVEEIERSHLKPDAGIFSHLVKLFAQVGDVPRVNKWLNAQRERGIEPNAYTVSTLLELYAKRGEFEAAEGLYADTRPKVRDAEAVKMSMLKSRAYGGDAIGAKQIYHLVKPKDLVQRRRALQLWIVACGRAEDRSMLNDAQMKVEDEPDLLDVLMVNALLGAWFRIGSEADAMHWLQTADEKSLALDQVSYGILHSNLRRLGRLESAAEIKDRAAGEGIDVTATRKGSRKMRAHGEIESQQ